MVGVVWAELKRHLNSQQTSIRESTLAGLYGPISAILIVRGTIGTLLKVRDVGTLPATGTLFR